MCGIAGSFGSLSDATEQCVARMNHAQTHRGPDQSGLWRSEGDSGVVLGHRRLSIIDLSDAGRQPMVDEGTGVALAFNGECYNFRELRRELEAAGRRFRSTSDTEVVLGAYILWGRAALERLRGMFALALWDPRDESLLLARDRLGIKPLYYTQQDNSLLFASELRGLLASELVPRKLDGSSLAAYLWNGFVPGPGTLIDGVSLLPAGHMLSISRRSAAELRRYWSYPQTTSDLYGGSDAGKLAERALEEAVAQHLVSDVPLGIFLSGGVDSSVMAAMAQSGTSHPVTTFNVRFDEARYDESAYARKVAESLGTEHREVTLTEAYFAEHLDDALECLDQPTFDALNTYFVSRSVKEAGLTVALAGTGGDELFGGYSSFRDIPRARRLATPLGQLPKHLLNIAGHGAARVMMGQPGAVRPQTRWGKFADAMATRGDLLSMYQVSYSLFSMDFLDTLLLNPADDTAWGLTPGYRSELLSRSGGASELTAISNLEVGSFLGERLLRDTDAASMAVSLEVRVPLLDHVFIEALAAVPESERFHPLGKKMMLRNMVADRIDPALFDREKAGFELPLAIWCKRLLSDRLRSTFQDINLAHAIGLNAESVGRLWRAFDQGGAGIYWSRVWSIYVLMTWCRRHNVYL